VRRAAISALQERELENAVVLEALLDCCRTEKDYAVLRHIVRALGALRGDRMTGPMVDTIVDCMRGDDAPARWAAIELVRTWCCFGRRACEQGPIGMHPQC
jgi:hypothetical protein